VLYAKIPATASPAQFKTHNLPQILSNLIYAPQLFAHSVFDVVADYEIEFFIGEAVFFYENIHLFYKA
jgi:hypothetical protein